MTAELKAKRTFADISKMYSEDKAQEKLNALVLGTYGSGKTTLAATCPSPVLIHSFDPGGTKGLKAEIEAGKIFVDTRFEHDDTKTKSAATKAFRLWDKELEKLVDENFFDGVGTYFIDSFTTLLMAMKNAIASSKGRKDGILEIQDWQIVSNTLRDAIALLVSLPCNVILTGHLTSDKDETTGRLISSIAAPKSLQTLLPVLMDEIYVMEGKNTEKDSDYKLYTSSTARYTCRTRLGRNKLEHTEEPNIRNILKKVGLPYEDKS